MSYRDQLYPWCIILEQPNLQTVIVNRFRRRNEAEYHLQVLKRLAPSLNYSLMFDPILDPPIADDSPHPTLRSNRRPRLKIK